MTGLASRTERKLRFNDAVAEQHDVPSRGANPDSTMRIRGKVAALELRVGNTSRIWKSRMRTSFRGLPLHAAQIFPSVSSVIATTIPSGW